MRWCKENVKKDEDEAGEEQGKKRVSCVSFGRDRNDRGKREIKDVLGKMPETCKKGNGKI